MILPPPILTALLATLAPVDEPDWIDLFLEGDHALVRGELDRARDALARALELVPEHAATAWQLAAVEARRGDVDGALDWLERAIEWGGGDAALLDWDPDLAPLRETERCAELRGRIAAPPAEPLTADLAWHGGGYALSASPGAEVVATGRTGDTFLWDLRAGEALAVLDRPGWDVAWVALDPRGRFAVTTGSREGRGSEESLLRVFDARTGDLVRELDDAGWQAGIEFSADGGRMLARGHVGPAGGVWDTERWERIVDLPQRSPAGIPEQLRGQLLHGPDQCRLSPDGTRLVVLFRGAAETSALSFLDVDGGQVVAEHEIASIPNTEIDVSSDGQLALALENRGDRLHVYDARTGEERHAIDVGGMDVRTATFLGATGELATIGEALHVWSARDGQLLRSLPFEADAEGTVWSQLLASPDGATLLVHTWFGPLYALDSENGRLLWSCGHEPHGGVAAMRFSPDGTRVLIRDFGAPDTVRDARTGTVLHEIGGPALDTTALAHPTRDEVWLGVADGSLRRIDAATGRMLASFRHGAAGISGLSFAPGGERLATTDVAGVLRVIDTKDGALVCRVPAVVPSDAERFLAENGFAPDGASVLVSGPRGTLAVYDAGDATRLCTIAAVERSFDWAWSPDGSRIAVAEGSRVRTYDARSGRRLGPEIELEGDLRVVAYEPGGERLWVGDGKSRIHVVDAAGGAVVRVLDVGDLDPFDVVDLASISFDAAGERAVTASSGIGVVAGWEVATGERLWGYSYSGGNPASILSAFGASAERVYVFGQGPWSTRVLDAASGRILLDLEDRELGDLLPLPGERLVAANGPEGLEVLDLATGARRWSRLELGDDGWLRGTPSRHFDGTRAALEQVHLVLEQRSFPLDALAAALLDPRRVRAAAAGVALAPARLPAPPELVWATPAPRDLRLAPDESPPAFTLEATCPAGVAGFEVRVAGRRARVEGEAVDATHRRLRLELATPAPGAEVHYRWRAIGTHGVLGRALHLTVTGG